MNVVPPLRAPVSDGLEVSRYVATPRAKRSFHTILDAGQIFDSRTPSVVTTRVGSENGARLVEIKTEHQIRGGKISESLELSGDGQLRALRLERRLTDDAGSATREEKVEFTRGPLPMPAATYPEVMLPFVLRWQPWDHERRSVYAWTVDRFVARVYCEWAGRHALSVPAGRIETLEMVMYPDLNDWVSMGSMLNTLAKPLLPKYRMWFEAADTRRVVRYEGPYGPPGAPEIVLELA